MKNKQRNNAEKKNEFRSFIEKEFTKTIEKYSKKFPSKDVLKMDLHCHDKNSDTTDELLGRILDIPETWLETADLVKTLQAQGAGAITVTNHNNARSCFELLDKGVDVLVGAEFSCYVPGHNVGIHVLTYGFDPEQEEVLNKKRGNIYKFLEYARKEDIPTIWAHPLFYYTANGTRTIELFEKLSLLFERFEAVNGQRNAWQNVLTDRWVKTLTEEKIKKLARKHDVYLPDYCTSPYKKSVSGGSDSHMGIFPGLTGTYLHVPGLEEALKSKPASALALEAIKAGRMAPYGAPNESERLSVAILDYFCQIALNMKDPGLLRMLLHKGSHKEKFLGFLLTNGFSELKNHRVTMNFLKTFHNSFTGTVPGGAKQFLIKKAYKSVFEQTRQLAIIKKKNPEQLSADYLSGFIKNTFNQLNDVFFDRLNAKLEPMLNNPNPPSTFSDMENLIRNLEMPAGMRSYFNHKSGKGKGIDVGDFLDGLSFPFLASSVIYGAVYAGAKVMNHSHGFLNVLSDEMKFPKPPKRVLWMSDTFSDKNGVAASIRDLHREVKARNLPVDIMVCDSEVEPDDHLIVVRPMLSVRLPFYKEQPLRVPNILEVHNLFARGGYDRIVASTEGSLGLIALLLKNAFSVPAYFYLHTDWITFMKKSLNLDIHMINRVRRMLRLFYRQFDGHFVLNSDQRAWLGGRDMGLNSQKIFLTGHWVNGDLKPSKPDAQKVFGVKPGEKVILFIGRISAEKGVMDLPYIYSKVKKEHPEVRLAVVGSGPAEAELKADIPDLIHIPWVDFKQLGGIYSAAEILVLPSVFDTFGRVLLEAMQCGCPVASYAKMGPKDIIEHGKSGFLAKSKQGMSKQIIEFFNDEKQRKRMSEHAKKRAKTYSADKIIQRMMLNIGL